MKGVIISAFDTCIDRVLLLKEYYESKGHLITYIASSFSHTKKEEYKIEQANIQIPVLEYKKNLSIARLRSHYGFSQDCLKELEGIQPDFIHCLIPPNSLTKTMAKYKERHPEIYLILDIIDVWPETLPIRYFKSFWPFTIWKNQRDRFIDQADLIYTECNLFQSVLPQLKSKIHTLYWVREQMPLENSFHLKEDQLHFCYLGAINNIIDIERITVLLEACQKRKKTILHIIGQGESKDSFIQWITSVGVQVIDHGSIFDQEKKQEIFNQCHYGINMMKESVVVGLSMKSLDYMCGQLPIINTIGGDTHSLCEQYDIGYNVTMDTMEQVVNDIVNKTVEENYIQRKNICNLYLRYFTKDSFYSTLEGTLPFK